MSLVSLGLGNTTGSGGGSLFQVSSLAVTSTTLTVTFTDTVTIQGPAAVPSNYSITGPSPVTVTAVAAVGNTLVLTVTAQRTGGAYRLDYPQQGLIGSTSGAFAGPYGSSFTGVGSPVTIQSIKAVDERTLDVIFSRAVMQVDAQNPANYSISSGVPVLSATRITDFWYRLSTGATIVIGAYSCSVSGIRDINGNS